MVCLNGMCRSSWSASLNAFLNKDHNSNLIFYEMKKQLDCWIETETYSTRNFRRGVGWGGGDPGPSDIKNALTTCFFESTTYFTEVEWLLSKKIIIFQRSRGGGGVHHFPGGPTFSKGGWGGVQLLIPYSNPYNL